MGQEYREVLRAAFCRLWASVTEMLPDVANAQINPKNNAMLNNFMGSRTVSFGSFCSSIDANPSSGWNELFLFQVDLDDVRSHCPDASIRPVSNRRS